MRSTNGLGVSMRHSVSGIGVAALLAIAPIRPSAPLQDRVAELIRIHGEYVAERERPSITQLVQMDRELRRLLPYRRWEGPPMSASGFRPELQQIGVRPLPFDSDVLGYTGKLLVEAHQRNPWIHRRETLYSMVFGDREVDGSVPSPSAAEVYLAEFPDGPFAVLAHLALVGFYSDLRQVLQRLEDDAARDYKYACYRQYVEPGRLAEQKARAQAQAIAHASTLTTLRPTVAWFGQLLKDLTAGSGSYWHYCAD